MPDTIETEERRPLLANLVPQPEHSDSEVRGDLERGESGCEAPTWREWTAERLEAPATHKAIIVLIAIDASCVLADLTYTFLSPERDCATPSFSSSSSTSLLHTLIEDAEPVWLTVLAHISLAINTLFLAEIPLALWCFGLSFYNPFPKRGGGGGGTPYATLHLFDALVVLATFILEVVLRGREAELAGLLILLRLWRLVKLVGGIAVGAGELQEELSNQLAETEGLLRDERTRVEKLEDENAKLRARLANTSVSVASMEAEGTF